MSIQQGGAGVERHHETTPAKTTSALRTMVNHFADLETERPCLPATVFISNGSLPGDCDMGEI
jgi:hypothetical protein